MLSKEPQFAKWKEWSYDDYLDYYLSYKAVKKRIKGVSWPELSLSSDDLRMFCQPIRKRITDLCNSKTPQVSIIIPALNEESELIPTILSYTLLDVKPGVFELTIVDNNSTDRTAEIIKNCGANYQFCSKKGWTVPIDKGFRSISKSSKYVWLSDADTRVTRPFRAKEKKDKSNILGLYLKYVEQYPTIYGISSGTLFDSVHWSHKLLHAIALFFKKTNKYSCWQGNNQFIRRDVLDKVGINTNVGSIHDQERAFRIARLAKEEERGGKVLSAARDPNLFDPVYVSGRRYGSFKRVIKHLIRYHLNMKRTRIIGRDEYGYPIYGDNVTRPRDYT